MEHSDTDTTTPTPNNPNKEQSPTKKRGFLPSMTNITEALQAAKHGPSIDTSFSNETPPTTTAHEEEDSNHHNNGNNVDNDNTGTTALSSEFYCGLVRPSMEDVASIPPTSAPFTTSTTKTRRPAQSSSSSPTTATTTTTTNTTTTTTPPIAKSPSSHNIPLSMKISRSLYNLCCQACGVPRTTHFQPFQFQESVTTTLNTQIARGSAANISSQDEDANQQHPTTTTNNNNNNNNIHNTFPSPLTTQPKPTPDIIHTILQQYISATQFYNCQTANAGILTTIRFSLPTLRVTSSFHDSDMLALSEILFQHANTTLSHIRRLDFSVGGLRGKLYGTRGFRSHGALTLSKVLENTRFVKEVMVQRNMIGPYGASALFRSCCANPTIEVLMMRRCRVGERGALAFVEEMGKGGSGLKHVDLSVNRIGFRGTLAIEDMLEVMEKVREEKGVGEGEGEEMVEIDMEGNLVFQEVMNGVTHGLGIVLCVVGACMLSNKVKNGPVNNIVSCGLYSFSLLVLYTSSTLYHSFFALTVTRYVFAVLDHCAIYILIAGSYTPFLRIAMIDKPLGSVYLLSFIWICCILGLIVEAFYSEWVYKPRFTLSMYLGMGWSCVVCFPDLKESLPTESLQMIVLGGVAYTSGVPFFVRNNNLDHTIWHVFVMAGSICHWLSVYWYVAPMNQGPIGLVE